MRMYIGGEWVDKPEKAVVRNKYDGAEIDTVPLADAADVERAVASAVRGAEVMRKMSPYDRYHILRRAADLLAQRQEEFGRTITLEEGKVLSEGLLEASRTVETLTGSAEEAKRIHGETVPVDAAPGGANKFSFTIRVPCGVVAAITPFNFPLNLVMHKVGPALAAGNAVIVKPASDTPLSALKLVELLLEAGLPAEAIQCVTGPGAKLGGIISTDPRIRKITFTGSLEVGEQICKLAGIKKVTMELGSNCPVIVMRDADLDEAVRAYGGDRLLQRRAGVPLRPKDPGGLPGVHGLPRPVEVKGRRDRAGRSPQARRENGAADPRAGRHPREPVDPRGAGRRGSAGHRGRSPGGAA